MRSDLITQCFNAKSIFIALLIAGAATIGWLVGSDKLADQRAHSTVSDACRIVEPKLQMSDYRSGLEYLNAIRSTFKNDYWSFVQVKHGDRVHQLGDSMGQHDFKHACGVAGRPDLELSFYFKRHGKGAPMVILTFLTLLGASLMGLLLFYSFITRGQKLALALFDEHLKRQLSLGNDEGGNTQGSNHGHPFFGSSKVIQDIRERVRDLEKKVSNKNKELAEQRVDIALGQLARRTAHDIRSPLNYLKVLLSTNAPVGSRERERLRNVAERIEGIADDLLSRHRSQILRTRPVDRALEMGKESVEVDIDCVVKELIEERSMCGQKLVCSAASGPLTVKANPHELYRVLSNILNNAAEASNGQPIYIETKRELNAVVVSISDCGPGISPGVLQSIASGRSVTTKSEGNGIGLLSAMSYLSTVGGSLSLSNQKKGGAVVTLKLPSDVEFVKEMRSPNIEMTQHMGPSAGG